MNKATTTTSDLEQLNELLVKFGISGYHANSVREEARNALPPELRPASPLRISVYLEFTPDRNIEDEVTKYCEEDETSSQHDALVAQITEALKRQTFSAFGASLKLEALSYLEFSDHD